MKRSFLFAALTLVLVGCDSGSTDTPQTEHPADPPEPTANGRSAFSSQIEGAPLPASSTGTARVRIEKTEFRITLPDGRLMKQEELAGVVLTVHDDTGASRRVRIDEVTVDPKNADLTMYSLSVEDPETGARGNFCEPGPDGLRLGFPLAGEWTSDGRHLPSDVHFNVTCTAGAIGKCVRFGYRPWDRRGDVSLWDHHQACVRMMRADYCGDGHPFTKNGMLIDLYDELAIQTREPSDPSPFEAGWSPEGALCVHHPRVPENGSLADIERRCPERLRGRTGSVCTEAAVKGMQGLKLMNLSSGN